MVEVIHSTANNTTYNKTMGLNKDASTAHVVPGRNQVNWTVSAERTVFTPSLNVVQTAGLPSGSVFPQGITTNTFMAVSADGQDTSYCSFNVTVAGCDTSLALVSDSGWTLSTVTTTATANSFPWPGVTTVPADPTYTLPVDVGQPYAWEHLYTVPGSQVITAEAGVTYYRNTFEIVDPVGITARFRMFVDDDMQIFINGKWIALEDDMGIDNWRTANHDLVLNGDGSVDNGYSGGDAFDFVTILPTDSIFTTGTNTITLAIRNRTSKPDIGGFSFRMDLDRGAVAKSGAAGSVAAEGTDKLVIFPNPTSGRVTVSLNHSTESGVEGTVKVFDFSGKLVQSQSIYSETELDLSALPSGVYMLKVSSGSETYTQKVVKN